MAFVRFRTLSADHYFAEHVIVKMTVTDSDDPQRGPHMTVLKIRNSNGHVWEETFYSEPDFV